MEQEQWIFDASGNKLHRVRIQNVEPLIGEIRAAKNENPNGFTKDRTMRRIGEVPMILVAEMMKQGINPLQKGNEKAVLRFLNENSKFRTVDRML